MFFTWTEKDKNLNIWELTSHSHVQQYLELKREADPELPESLFIGLSRIMTGSTFVSEERTLKFATDGAQSKSPVGVLVVKKLADGKVFLNYPESKAADAIPYLSFANDEEVNPIEFGLTPKRYEFLICLAEGFTPTSFSTQCQSEFYSLKARLTRTTQKKYGIAKMITVELLNKKIKVSPYKED